MEKMDARKRYTQMVLKQSFSELLKEKPVKQNYGEGGLRWRSLTATFLCPLQRLFCPDGEH